jgi:hypothetical protein
MPNLKLAQVSARLELVRHKYSETQFWLSVSLPLGCTLKNHICLLSFDVSNDVDFILPTSSMHELKFSIVQKTPTLEKLAILKYSHKT